MPIRSKITLWLESIQNGFVLILPIIIIGSLALTVIQIPILFPGYLASSFLLELASWVLAATLNIMALTLTISISYYLSKAYNRTYNLSFFPITIASISTVCFLGILTIDHGDLVINNLGVTSVAKAIICAITTTEICIFFFKNKITQFSFLEHELNEDIYFALRAIFPAIAATFIILGTYSLLLTDIDFISRLIPFALGPVNNETGLSYLQSNILILINQLVWFVGIHPSSFIEVSKEAIFSTNIAANYSRHFLDIYAHIGGAGSTLGLIIALLFSKRRQHNQIAKYATLPALFNINELLIFGIPIVFNRFLLIPFVLTPIVTTTIARLCLELNFVSIDPSQTHWNTPALLSGYLSSGNISGVILQLLLILISAAIYWPFVKRYDQLLKIKEESTVSTMIKDLCEPDINFSQLITEQSPLGLFCRRLKYDLHTQLNDQHLEMVYQPKMDCNRSLDGMEALVRWKHPKLGNIPPCIFVNIAETDDQIIKLGSWINQRCMKDINIFRKAGMPKIQVAINVSPLQLQEKLFFYNFQNTLEEYNILPNQIELEITEGQKLHLTDEILTGIKDLSNKGTSIAVDDFGMGCTSLRYLKSFNVDTIKLDGSIVSDVTSSNVAQEIIRSLSSLTQSMDSKLVAEWVETEEQFEILASLGCNQFQGAYFSMPITRDDLILYWKGHPSIA